MEYLKYGRKKIWLALYNPCKWESSFATLSLHSSKAGAKRAIKEHREYKFKEWKKYRDRMKLHFSDEGFEHVVSPESKWDEHELWDISCEYLLP